MRTALITGVAGQDGSYLAEHLLKLGYKVHGTLRRDDRNIKNLAAVRDKITFHYADMRDVLSLETVFRKANPDEVYNLAAQPFIPASWTQPTETLDINTGGLLRLLQIIENVKPSTRIYQASSSEMFGNNGTQASENTSFRPVSPYGVSKLASHELCRVYREKGIYAVSGILFNHESPRRGAEMVTQKIVLGLVAWVPDLWRNRVKLGNVTARRDWGFAGDYVRAMHLMLQEPYPEDYVIGTGVSHSILEFVDETVRQLYYFTGDSIFKQAGMNFIEVDPSFIRANEIQHLVADATNARNNLGWEPTTSFESLVRMMVQAELGL